MSSPAVSTICAFVALEVPRPFQAQCAKEIARLEKEMPGVEWVDARRMHLTLRFLGWTTRERLAALEPSLRAAAEACAPFDATASGLGTFPLTGGARVLWIGINLRRSGAALQAACEAAVVEGGFPPERRTFRAHLTLGRWKVPVRPRSLPDIDLGPVRLENLAVYRTEPAKSEAGVRRAISAYARLAVFPLG